MRVALFPGSFDPFTRGHQAIVQRALPMFDKLVIAIGVNRAKKGWMPIEERLERLRTLYANEPRVEVVAYETLNIYCVVCVRWQILNMNALSPMPIVVLQGLKQCFLSLMPILPIFHHRW